MVSIGSLLDETEVLEWMMDQKNDNSIEEINRDKLYEYIDGKEFLAVIFCEYKLKITLFFTSLDVINTNETTKNLRFTILCSSWTTSNYLFLAIIMATASQYSAIWKTWFSFRIVFHLMYMDSSIMFPSETSYKVHNVNIDDHCLQNTNPRQDNPRWDIQILSICLFVC